ncbi:MAG: hypothetical protein LBH00_05845 [Planctomycetaceae bacterium]|nr:hypothetical protein [Planctomycetaceae bacterium]
MPKSNVWGKLMNEHKFARMSHHEQTLHEIRQQIKTGLAESRTYKTK